MELTIKELDRRNIRDINCCNGEFTIDSKLVLNLNTEEIGYEIVPVPFSRKRYEEDDIEPSSYLDHPDKRVFLAYVNGEIAGHIILRENWNRFAYVEDIIVDIQFRRQGIGVELISHARCWAQERHLPGIILETQNNNVTACKFYEKCGFRLGGFGDNPVYPQGIV